MHMTHSKGIYPTLSPEDKKRERERERSRNLIREIEEFGQSKKFIESVLKKLKGVSSLNNKSLLRVAEYIFEEFENFKYEVGLRYIPEHDIKEIGNYLKALELGDASIKTTILVKLRAHFGELYVFLEDYQTRKFSNQ